MKINFNQELKKLDGSKFSRKEVPEACPKCGHVLLKEGTTLKEIAADALSMIYQDEAGLPGSEKAKRGLLAMRIYANPESINLTTEEISDIKKIIGKAPFNNVVIAQAWDMLEEGKVE